MKKYVLMSMLIVATLTVLSTAVKAQSRLNWSATVPFEFTAGGKTFPPGEYSVKIVNSISDRPALRIQNIETREAAIVQTMSETTKHRSDVTAVQFRRYGDRYFFGAVQMSGESLTLRVPKSKSERAKWSEIAKHGDWVTVVMKS